MGLLEVLGFIRHLAMMTCNPLARPCAGGDGWQHGNFLIIHLVELPREVGSQLKLQGLRTCFLSPHFL